MFQYPFGDVVLNPRLPLYQQGNSMDLDIMSNSRTEYLFWKVEDKAAYLPPLSDIKDEVKAAWKRLEAQKLADKKAQEIARRVEQLKESPWDALEQAERGLVVNPPAFSAMMPSFGRGEPQMSPVDQIDSAGASFVTKVFSMTPGQVSVAANQPQSIYYVIRLVEKLPNETELRTMFERMPVQPDTRNLGFREIQPIFSDWVESIEKDLQVEWMVPKGSLMMQD